MKSSNIGGQAVLEGIMMRHKDLYSVAVRKPDGEIEIKTEPYKSIVKSKWLKETPIIRGVFNFVESLVVGMKCLTYSSSFFEEEEEKVTLTEEEQAKADAKKEKQDKVIMGLTVAFSIVLSVGIFIMLPYFIASFLRKITETEWVIAVAEAVARILIFVIYIVLISKMKEIQRVFMYHGAEHKCINCIEQGLELNIENVKKSSKHHKRCGTSFLLIVMLVSIVFFIFIQVDSKILKLVLRLLLIPVIAGVSYEFIRLAGKFDNWFVNLFSAPGMWMQKITTKEPDDEMIEVGIASVEAVFDWKEWQKEL